MVYIPGLGGSSFPGGLAGIPGADGAAGQNGYGVSTADGRLTTVSGTPILTSNQLAKTTLYYTPFKGNQIAVYADGAWSVLSFAETSLSLSGYTANKNYDIWGYNNNGTFALDSTVWTNDTTRATALTTQDGIYCKTGDTTRRYLGTVRINSTGGQIDWSLGGAGSGGTNARFTIWNAVNRVKFNAVLSNSDDSWTQTGLGAYRIAANSSVPHRVDLVCGIASFFRAKYHNKPSAATANMIVSIGLDSTTAKATSAVAGQSNLTNTYVEGAFSGVISEGAHYLAPIEFTGAATATWVGDAGASQQQFGMTFEGEF